MNRKRFHRIILILLVSLMACTTACKKKELEQDEAGMTESDKRKMQAYLEKIQKKTELADLPEQYHDRTLPDFKAGVLFGVYLDGKFLKNVGKDEFKCATSEQLLSRKGPNVHINCPLLPFLQSLAAKPVTYLDVVGEARKFSYHRFIPSKMETDNEELVGFLAPRGQLRVEERPLAALTATEGEGPQGQGDGSGGGMKSGKGERQKGEARKQKGAMRGKYKTRALYWVDLYTGPIPEEPAPGEELTAPQHQGRPRPSRPGDVVLTLPDGSSRELTPDDIAKCGDAGCAVSELLGAGAGGRWCVAYQGGVTVQDYEQLSQLRLRQRRQGQGIVLQGEGRGEGNAIRDPTSIGPCP